MTIYLCSKNALPWLEKTDMDYICAQISLTL